MAALQRPELSLIGIPLELRIKIFEHLFADLIEELSDNLFAAFQVYDNAYNYTASYMESHVGRTGLTPILYTCKQIHAEALSILCEQADIVVNVLGGDDDPNDQERAAVRFPEGSRYLGFARNLKVNFLFDQPADQYIRRLSRFLDVIQNGGNLRSLKIFIDVSSTIDRSAADHIMNTLGALKMPGKSVKVYLGQVDEAVLSDEQLTLLLDSIDGHKMRRGHNQPGPTYYGDESDSETTE
ncbi:hypothetical protein F4779DRAFT_462957 [Xylariaceae sp. FL0662B]|nr:hypothetical protein F4779DRAFT_462957 [Xylariaceae sp. FL0662B]